ncbi:MAG: GAF domain-containing protein [Cytophagales bacterium]|nr:GAF domain-containing protein [Cytophagales bacterium]
MNLADFINNLTVANTIRKKLYLLFSLLVVLIIGIGIWNGYMILRTFYYQNIFDDVNKVMINILECRQLEDVFLKDDTKSDDFHSKGESINLKKIENEITHTNALIDNLRGKNFMNKQVELANTLDMLEKELKMYEYNLRNLSIHFRQRGFKDYGLEGALRNAIHAVEKSNVDYDKVIMLTLRRHEKDFFLRKDMKYFDKFNDEIPKFKSSLTNSKISRAQADSMMALLDAYHKFFKEIVEIEKNIGLKETEGLYGKLNASTYNLRKYSETLQINAQKLIDEAIQNLFFWLIVALIVLVTGTIAIVIYLVEKLEKPLNLVKISLAELSDGGIPKSEDIQTKDIILGTIVNAIHSIVERIKYLTNFATDIGHEKFDSHFEIKRDDDLLGKALVDMKHRLKYAKEESENRNTFTEKYTKFTEMLKNDYNSMEELGDDVVKNIVKAVNANQAGFFLYDKEQNVLVMHACYAYERKKYLQKNIEPGVGLVGQCYEEKDTLYITDVPDNYIQIRSGLGGSNPTCIALFPFIQNDECLGVVEIASLKELSQSQLDFLKRVSESIASTIYIYENNIRTKKILTETQLQAEMLKANEEEMRQNMEELHATQEEMIRKEKSYLQKIQILETKLAKYEDITSLHLVE